MTSQETPSSEREPLFIDQSLVGPTYHPNELLTKLYFENQILHSEREIYTVGEGLVLPSLESIRLDPKFEYARFYIEKPERNSAPRHLIIANEYPREGREYANGFVHRRVKYYQDKGLEVDVIAFGKRVPNDVYEYDGARILSGYVNELQALLTTADYKSISVHFMNPDMWKVLKGAVPATTKLIVYIHGYEVDSWIRRPFQIENRSTMIKYMKRSFMLRDFWRELVNPNSGVDSFVFVSNWWMRAVSDDLGIDFSLLPNSVIHNVIDESLFSYEPKDISQRFKFLWVRSAHTRKYGADIAVSILESLKETSHWQDLEIKIIGDGAYFSEFEEAFGDDPNVLVERRFVSQEEMASLHKQNGFFLVPTRYDSQGVARDEAMSSGLIPITNPVSAVPEFVDEDCAVLGDLNDSAGIAQKIVQILEDPEEFLRMSSHAATRVRQQCGSENTVVKEIELMEGRVPC